MKLLIIILMSLIILPMSRADVVELFGQADDTWDAQISPNGENVAVGCNPGGLQSICIFDIETGEQKGFIYPGSEMNIDWFYWGSDRFLVTNVSFWQRAYFDSGLEWLTQRVAISYDLKTKKYAQLMKDVDGFWDHMTDVAAVCENDPERVIMALSYRVGDQYFGVAGQLSKRGLRTDHYRVNLRTGKSKKLRARRASIFQTVFGDDCEPLVDVAFNDQRQEFSVSLAGRSDPIFQYDGADIDPIDVIGLNRDRDALIIRADFDETYGMFTMNLTDGALEPLTYEGASLGRMGIVFDRFSGNIAGFRATDHLEQHLYIDEDLRALQRLVEGALPDHIARVTSFSRDRTYYTVAAEALGKPVQHFFFDKQLNQLSPLGSVAPQLEGRSLGNILPISYPARDGITIPGYVTLPPGATLEDGPFPMVVLPHGGPEARDTAAFDWWPQAYASAGYAVLQPNFRGSAGYGKTFRDAGFGEFGGKMVDDVVDSIAWATDAGLSHPDGVCVVGASYGGYSALMSGLNAPERTGCVVAVAPVTNIVSHMARYSRGSAPYRYWARYAGQNVFSRDAEVQAISPEQRAGEFKVPVLLMHGKEDSVVGIEQSKRFSDAWGNRNGLKFIEMNGEDHYLSTEAARKMVLAESLAFLQRHHPARSNIAGGTE